MPSIVALIPARAGSKRCPGKNTRLLAGKPLIQWTIEAAKSSGIFSRIVVCTDDEVLWSLATRLGVDYQTRDTVSDDQPDIEWVRDALTVLDDADAFAILRPTSPFRRPETIRDAWQYFLSEQPCDSLRAVRAVREHPGKMWSGHRGNRIVPLLPYYTRTGEDARDAPWHSAPTQSLPMFFVQTAMLEIAWAKTLTKTDTISGTNVLPLRLKDEYQIDEFDINTEADFFEAEEIAELLTSIP